VPGEWLPPNDPSQEYRSELPTIRGPRAPEGYKRSLELGSRFVGLLLVLFGLAGMALVYVLFQSGGLPGAPPPPAPPPGLNGMAVPSLVSVGSCLVPLLAIGSVGLIIVGLRRIVDPY
jgi:hypothetical protein